MRKIISIMLAVITATALLCSCNAKEEGLTKVRLNEVVHSVFYVPQYVAIEKGFFEEQGLDIDLSVGQGADKSMTALIAGDADIALLGTEAGIYIYNEGRENYAVAFAQLTQRAGNFLISRSEESDFKWEDLRGKSVIGARTGGMPELILEYILKQNGLTPFEDVEIINNVSYGSTSGAFIGGVGDYTVEFEPTATALEAENKGYVVASLGTDSGYVPYTVYMATKEYMEQNPDIIQKFTNAIYKAQLWTKEHTSAEIAEVIAPYFEENDVETLEKIVERYKQQDTWKEDPIFGQEGFELIQNIMEEGGELSARVPYDEFINTEFAEKAIDSIQ